MPNDGMYTRDVHRIARNLELFAVKQKSSALALVQMDPAGSLSKMEECEILATTNVVKAVFCPLRSRAVTCKMLSASD